MKKQRFIPILAALLLLPGGLMAQTTDGGVTPFADAVRTLVFDNSKAVIVPDSVSGYEDSRMANGAGVQVSGTEMTFSRHIGTVRIHLKPGTIYRIMAEGSSDVTFQGTFHFVGTLELSAEDASTITLKNSFDTLYADRLVVNLEDVASLNAHSRLQMRTYDFAVKDFSRMKAFIVEVTEPTVEGKQLWHMTSTTYASYHFGHRLFPGHREDISPEEMEEFWNTDDDALDLDDLADFDSDALAELLRRIKISRTKRYLWGTNLDFAWGFHNWGSDRFNGLMGTDGDAAVRTSFNHILLTLNYPVLYSRRVALFAGLGLEWDKYKFHRGDIHFDLTAEPYHLVNGPVANSESRLLTRYVILPIEVKFDLGRHWRLGFAAIPGLHWSGSHTGLRRDITSGDDETNIKDYSVNPYINPYKLDARISVQYRSIGVYFQASMLPAFKSSCDELFPVKFGIIL